MSSNPTSIDPDEFAQRLHTLSAAADTIAEHAPRSGQLGLVTDHQQVGHDGLATALTALDTQYGQWITTLYGTSSDHVDALRQTLDTTVETDRAAAEHLNRLGGTQ